MSSSASARIGRQEPRIRLEPSLAYTDGPDAGYFCAQYGMKPDEWQQMVLDCWLGRDERDRYTATTCGLALPRQNGKNGVLEMRELYGIVACGEKILHTAHEVKTARKAFLRLASYFEDERRWPELANAVQQIRRTNGQEGILLKPRHGPDGTVVQGEIEFSARSRGAARGFTADVLVMDEAQELQDEQLEALMYTISASPNDNRQMIYTGTPTPPGSKGEVFGRVRQVVVDGKADDRTAWHEWGVEHLPDPEKDDLLALAYETNPAMGIRITEDFTKTEMQTSTLDGFARERLGWWPETGKVVTAIDQRAWAECLDEDPSPEGKTAVGVKFSPDGVFCAVAGAKWKHGSPAVVELIAYEDITERGVKWVAEWLDANRDKIAYTLIDGRGNAEALAGELRDLRVPGTAYGLCTSVQAATAASMMLNAVKERDVRHTGQEQLDESVRTTAKRPIGNMGAFGFGGEDAYPLEAAALAHFAVKTTKRDPGRKLRIL